MPPRNTPEFMTLVAVAVGLAAAITVSAVRRRRASAGKPVPQRRADNGTAAPTGDRRPGA